MPKKVLWRLLIWLVLMSYIALDFLVLKGPLHKQLKAREGEVVLPDSERGIAARVFHKPIYLSQIDYAVDEILWSSGRSREGIADTERTYLRQVAMRDLADQYILRTKLREQQEKYPVSEDQINSAIKRFSDRFENKEDFILSLKKMGIKGEQELRYRMIAKLQQELYIEKFTKVDQAVLEEEAMRAYQENKAEYAVPERAKVQHIFCAKLENSKEEALEKLSRAKALLEQDLEDFALIAREISEDERTKTSAGDLGWIRKNRIAPDFTEAVFKASVGEVELIETVLGWHLILVTAKEKARERSFEEVKAELMTSLENFQRKNNVEKFRISLRKQQADKIKIDWDMLQRPWTEG